MFKFLKEKLKSAVEIFSKKAEEESKEEINEEIKEEIKEEKPKKEAKKQKKVEEKKEIPEERVEKKEEIIAEEKIDEKEIKEEKKGFFEKIKEKFKKKEEAKEEIKEEKVKEKTEIKEEKIEKKKGLFEKIKEKITTVKISEDKFDELFNDLEIILLENNVAVEVIDKIKEDLNKSLVEKQIKRGEVEEEIKKCLRKALEEVLDVEKVDLIKEIKNKKEKPYVIVFVGVNGAGKTTTIARIANLLQKNNLSVVLGAGDSWRAASIEQLEEWGKRLNVKVIKHQYGSDPAAICFDTISFAKRQGIDVVLLDTAGRQHSNVNLMDEMKKIIRVAKPDFKIFVGEAIVGNDVVEQTNRFNEVVDIDGIILAKADIDEKGGAAISVGYVTKKPILYLGVGQGLNDLDSFDKDKIINSLGL